MARRKSVLTPYRGKPVNRTSIKVTNAGDGLSKAQEIAPVEYEPGSYVYVMHKCKVGVHGHVLDEDLDDYDLIQTFKALSATVVDADLAGPLIEKQEALIEEAQGVQRLPWNEPAENADELVAQHETGAHDDGLRDGCPSCIEIRLAYEAKKSKRGGKAAGLLE